MIPKIRASPTPLYTNRPVEPLEAKAAPLNLMCTLALPLENGFGLGAHASSVLILTISGDISVQLPYSNGIN